MGRNVDPENTRRRLVGTENREECTDSKASGNRTAWVDQRDLCWHLCHRTSRVSGQEKEREGGVKGKKENEWEGEREEGGSQSRMGLFSAGSRRQNGSRLQRKSMLCLQSSPNWKRGLLLLRVSKSNFWPLRTFLYNVLSVQTKWE